MPVKMNEVGVNAGKVWRLLENENNLSRRAIAKKLNISRFEVESALGWLARENKLVENEVENRFIPNSNRFVVFSVQN